MRRNIILFCSAGLSTSLLVNNMKKVAKEIGYDCNINAYGINELNRQVKNADIVLLGPQIKFNFDRVKSIAKDIPVILIEPRLYGSFDGHAIISLVKKELND